ncbi:Ig-like domain repeat protein [Marmoricola sp. RAF53]|uniref:Ig-like domain repeat protein n=1 Tax=Marmoricola sp. RAF53 TaxID=3233059 RepID=UPI003F9EAEDF
MGARLSVATVLALVAGSVLTVVAGVPAATAAQSTASGDNVPVWQTGSKWTYTDVMNDYDPNGTNMNVNETISYEVVGRQTFLGQDAYKLNVTGSIDGCSGPAVNGGSSATVSGCKNKSGTQGITGTRYVRVSDLALLQDYQHMDMTATANAGITVSVDISIDMTYTPTGTGWKMFDFPLNAGDGWTASAGMAYNGGYSYTAPVVGSASTPYNSANSGGPRTFSNSPVNVTSTTVNAAGNANLPVKKIVQGDANGLYRESYWSPQYGNEAKFIWRQPLNEGPVYTRTSTLTSAVLPSGNAISAPAVYSCANNVALSGTVAGAGAGVTVTARLDQSQIAAGQGATATATTGAGGSFSVSLPTGVASDNLNKTGAQPARASWGVFLSTPGAIGATTVVVAPNTCSSIAYTGATAGDSGSSVTVSAQLAVPASSGLAAGRTVTFSLSGGASVDATTNAQGVATATLPVTGGKRTATITASFAGGSTIDAASASAPFAVDQVLTTTGVVANPGTQDANEPVTFVATVTPDAAVNLPGTVQFQVDGANFGAPVALSNGTATSAAYVTGDLGFHNVSATYAPSGTVYVGSTGATQFRIRAPRSASTTTLTTSDATAVAGQPVTLSAHVGHDAGSDPLTGSVVFTDGSTVLGEVGLDASGNASLETGDLDFGDRSIVATYSGDEHYSVSASAPSLVHVAKADVDVTLTRSPQVSVSGESVNVTATVAAQSPSVGVPAGAVQLLVDGAAFGDPVDLTGGVATFPALTHLGAGNHTLAVSYPGSNRYKSGSASKSQLVTRADTTTSVISGPSPQVEDQTVTITATVAAEAPGSGSPTGNVQFFANGTSIGAAALEQVDGTNQATLQIDTLAPGTYDVTASYGGDVDFIASGSDAVEQKVIQATSVVATTTTVASSKNPSTFGELIGFTAHVVAEDGSAPTGAVQFSVDGAEMGAPVELDADGNAESATFGSPEPGDHSVIAAYVPVGGYALSGDVLTQEVHAASATVALTSSDAHSDQGQAVTFHATVSPASDGTGTPGGFVQFRVDGSPVGGAVAVNGAGEATSPSVATLTPGDHAVTAVYSGDRHFVPGSATLTQQVGLMATSTALTASSASTTYGGSVTFTATVTPASNALGAPTGTIAFVEGGTTLATVPAAAVGSTAKASFTTAFGAGTHTVKAVYSGATAFAGSTSAPTTVTVAKQATTLKADAALVKLTGGLGLNLGWLQARLTTPAGPLAGQPVVFTIGTTTVCTSTTDSAGVAGCNALPQLLALTLAGGYKATYAGSANYLGSSDTGSTIK